MAGVGDLAKDASELGTARNEKTPKVDPSVVKDVFASIITRAKGGEVVSIQGFGNFRMVDRKATKARNPKTGDTFDVPATKRMKFTASKTLKNTLNGTAKP